MISAILGGVRIFGGWALIIEISEIEFPFIFIIQLLGYPPFMETPEHTHDVRIGDEHPRGQGTVARVKEKAELGDP